MNNFRFFFAKMLYMSNRHVCGVHWSRCDNHMMMPTLQECGYYHLIALIWIFPRKQQKNLSN